MSDRPVSQITAGRVEIDGVHFTFQIPSWTTEQDAMAERLLRDWLTFITHAMAGRTNPATRLVIHELTLARPVEEAFAAYLWFRSAPR